MLVAGEAGVGKSALVEQLQADLPDARWSWGACDGLFTPRPLGPLLDLAGQVGGEICRDVAALHLWEGGGRGQRGGGGGGAVDTQAAAYLNGADGVAKGDNGKAAATSRKKLARWGRM